MRRTSVVSAMVRSSGAIILISTLLVVVLSIDSTSAYAVEQKAKVELLPYDLLSEDRERDEVNKVIATPTQVIENQVSKTWKSIVKQMLNNTSTGLKQKRTVPQVGSVTTLINLLTICRAMAMSGLLANPVFNYGRSAPLNTVFGQPPQSPTDMVSDLSGPSRTNNVLPVPGSPIPGDLAAPGSQLPDAGGLNAGGSTVTGSVADPARTINEGDIMPSYGLPI